MFVLCRCTLINKCLSNFWQRENNQCTQIVNVHPMKASVDNSQWVCVYRVVLTSRDSFFL